MGVRMRWGREGDRKGGNSGEDTRRMDGRGRGRALSKVLRLKGQGVGGECEEGECGEREGRRPRKIDVWGEARGEK